jgi:nucleotide-binding universal stress UspA family protein
MTFRSILCPVDFSTHSRSALRCALALARRFGSRLTVIYVNDPLLLAAAEPSSGGRRRFVEETNKELSRFVERSIPSRTAHPDIAYLVTVGNVADEIVRHATRLRSDVIVIGTHGLSGVSKAFFGSTTDRVLRLATTPVLAVPAVAGRRREAIIQMEIDRVIAPIDLAGEWQSDALRASAIAGLFGAELHLVHALAPMHTPPWLRARADINRGRVEKATRALDRVRSKLFSGQPSRAAVVVGDAAHEIARLTRRGRSLVVMSLRGTAGVWGARRGSIAYHVLTHASSPVLALPRRRIGGSLSKRAARAVDDILTARDRREIAGIDALLSSASSRKRPVS